MISPDNENRIVQEAETRRSFEGIANPELAEVLIEFSERLPRHARYTDPGYFLSTYYPYGFAPKPNQGEQLSGTQNLRNANIIPAIKSKIGNRVRYVYTHEYMLAFAAVYWKIRGAYSTGKHPNTEIKDLIGSLGRDSLSTLIKPRTLDPIAPLEEALHPDTYTREMDVAARNLATRSGK